MSEKEPEKEQEVPTEYTVGYRKPPVSGQFKKGQSGNAKGRRKRSKSFLALLDGAFGETVRVTENGRSKVITKREALAKQLSNKAAAGDIKSMKLILELIEAIDRIHGNTLEHESQEQKSTARQRVTEKLERIARNIEERRKQLEGQN